MEEEHALEQRAPRPKRRQRREAAANAADEQEHQLEATETAKQLEDNTGSVDRSDAAQPIPENSGPVEGTNRGPGGKNRQKDAVKAPKKDQKAGNGGQISERTVKSAGESGAAKQQRQKSEQLHFDSYVQVVTTDACDATPCIYLRAGNQRFMFNASEGLQRVLSQYKMVSLPKVDAYFITRVSTSTLAGLPGMLMGANASTATATALLGNTQCVDLYGPTSLSAYVKAFLPYVNSAIGCKPNELDCSAQDVATQLDPIVETQELTITPIVLRPTTSSIATAKGVQQAAAAEGEKPATKGTTTVSETAPVSETTPVSAAAPATEDGSGPIAAEIKPQDAAAVNGVAEGGADAGEDVKEQRPQKRRRTDVLQVPASGKPSKSRDVCVSYVVKLVDRPGKFNPKKAAQLGVPRGPLYGELQKGKSVMGANQRLVHAHEVLEGGTPGPVMFIVDCPSLEYLPSYTESPSVKSHLAASTEGDASPPPQVLVCHVGPLSVVQHAEYQEWLKSTWGPHCHHILPSHPASPDQPTYLHRSSVLQAKLHQLDAEVFPLPVALREAGSEEGGAAGKEDAAVNGTVEDVPSSSKPAPQIHTAGIGTKYILYPPHQAGLDFSVVPSVQDYKAAQQEFLKKYNAPSVNGHLAPAAVTEEQQAEREPAGDATENKPEQATTATGSEPSMLPVDDPSTVPADDESAPPADGKEPASAAAGSKLERTESANGCEPSKVPVVDESAQRADTKMTDSSEQTGMANGSETSKVPVDAESAQQAGTEAADKGQETDVVNGSDPSYIPLDDESAMEVDEKADKDDVVPACLQGIARNVLEVVFLGTASAMPGTYRNVSGTLVNMFDQGCFMVDCGEDSWPQVRRRYGEEAAEQLLARMQFVWVSHMHADHHGGLYPLLQRRRQVLGRSAPPLLIIGPHSLARVLYNYHQLMPMRYAFVPSPIAEKDDLQGAELPKQTLELLQRVKDNLQLKSLKTFKVDHGCAAHGLQLEGQSGWKVVFSGDTQPCDAIRQAASGASLLVHEATFEDSLEHEARMRHHSTISEALEVARKAGAYRVALTHFSQRYPKLPSNLNPAALKRAFCAFDYATINLADLERLPRIVSSWERLCHCLTADEPEPVIKD